MPVPLVIVGAWGVTKAVIAISCTLAGGAAAVDHFTGSHGAKWLVDKMGGENSIASQIIFGLLNTVGYLIEGAQNHIIRAIRMFLEDVPPIENQEAINHIQSFSTYLGFFNEWFSLTFALSLFGTYMTAWTIALGIKWLIKVIPGLGG